jgi:DNA-binding LacI/PurR family transcriptional regulator
MLGLIIDDILDPFFNELIKGAEKFARDKGYRLILATTDDEPIEKVIEALLNQSAVEGIIIGGTKHLINDKNIMDRIIKRSVPIVLLAHSFNDIPCVNVDNFKGGYLATNYLLSLGYKRIAIITGPDVDLREETVERLKGYKKALKEKDVEIYEEYIVNGKFSYESGYYAMERLLNLNKIPEAVFACDDSMALGAISAINEFNLKVPEDISIIGFDNIIQSKYSTPALTTIAQPRIEMGKRATELLINLINDDNAVKQKNIILPLKLIKRKSSKIKLPG